MQAARANYGVDPVAFLVIYLVSVPFFYYSIFRMVRALARKLQPRCHDLERGVSGFHRGAIPVRSSSSVTTCPGGSTG